MPRIILLFAAILLVIVVLGIFAYVSNFGLTVMAGLPLPGNSYIHSYSNSITNGVLSADNSVIIGYIVMLVVVCIWSYKYPNQGVAMAEIFMVFFLAFIYLTAYPAISNVANAFTFNTLIPTSDSALTGGYLLYLTLGALVFSAILNTRKRDEYT